MCWSPKLNLFELCSEKGIEVSNLDYQPVYIMMAQRLMQEMAPHSLTSPESFSSGGDACQILSLICDIRNYEKLFY